MNLAKDVAAEVSVRVLEVNRLLNEAAAIVHARSSSKESSMFRQAIGQVLGELLLGVVNPLYQHHPELKPPELL